jgi:hypothetical protein
MMAPAHSHWAACEIGQPWVAGSSDCWSFARRIWVERFGWDVPPVPVDPRDPRESRRALAGPPEDQGWVQVIKPAEGDAVLMARGAYPAHVGIWIEPDQGGVLHSIEVAGVVFTTPDRLAGLGYRIIGFYRRTVEGQGS